MIKKVLVIFILMEIIFINNCISNPENNNNSSDEVILIKKDTTPVENLDRQQNQPTAVVTLEVGGKNQETNTKPVAKNTPVIDVEKINRILNKLRESKKDRVAMYAGVVLKTYYAKQEPQVVKGTIIIKKNNKFKIHYIEPTEQYLISNGKTIWVYTPDLKQVIKQSANDSPMGSNFYVELEGSIEYYVNMSKTYIKEDEKSYMLIMYPKDKKAVNFEKMVVKINKEKLVPEYMGMLYQGVVTRVFFYNVRNYTQEQAAKMSELKDSNFEFIVPEGVEEIDTSLLSETK
ncbi:MAG: outer membrane lipoprotein carrier protein LolA [Candidatus Goldbacteria bacterium]|nr:outer membrane lipoprotein carrier protein LolA [Candidatus Goldiibacteriota bacterium]